MIAQITGTIQDVEEGAYVVDAGGVGYRIYVSTVDRQKLDSTITLYTYLAVRETAQDLYGFTTRDERAMFEQLLTIPKIGPKSAMQVMSQAELEVLVTAIQNSDASYLSKLSGIGKKTAEKIVVELRDKVESIGVTVGPTNSGDSDVIDALVSLGYPQKAVRDVLGDLDPNIGTNERIKQALQKLSA